MLTIDRMATGYRVAGTPARRASVARRLDRLARRALVDGLEQLAEEFSAEDGPYIVLRQLRLSLWFDPTGMADPAIARLWVTALAEALYRDLADAPRDRVARYDNRAAFLADWLADLPGAAGQGDWRYREFAVFEGQLPGLAATIVLGREVRLIGQTFGLLDRQKRLVRVAAVLDGANIARIWQDWTGAAPAPGPTLSAAVDRAKSCRSALPLTNFADPDARARHALGWLVSLTTSATPLPPEVAGPLAMQIASIAALLQALPELGWLLESGGPAATIAEALDAAPPTLWPTADWLRRAVTTAPPRRIADLAALADPHTGSKTAGRQAERPLIIRSSFSGVGLLLPAIRALRLGDRLGPPGLVLLMAHAIPKALRPLALRDAGVRWLAGCSPDQRLTDTIDWPRADDIAKAGQQSRQAGGAPHDKLVDPALRAVLDHFSAGLRGLPGSSTDYLARQFLMQPGEIHISPQDITLRLGSVPLRILLVMGGRTGPQGRVPWLADRQLIVEVAHV